MVLLYQGWTYWVFRKRIAVHHIPSPSPARLRPAMRPTDPRLRRHLAAPARELGGVLVTGRGAACWSSPRPGRSPGSSWRCVGGDGRSGSVAAVVATLVGPGCAGWAGDVCAAAAARVGSHLRAVLARPSLERRRGRPGAAASCRVLATRGVSAAEPYLTRYVPALVLACVLPPLTVVAIATQDVLSAVIVVATIPLVPGVRGTGRPGDAGPCRSSSGARWSPCPATSWT